MTQATSAPTNAAAKLPMTAIILTFNEEIHVGRCISRIAPHVERVIVVDSFSTDRTIEIAKSLGADVMQHPFKHQAEQFQWALDTCRVTSAWVLRLDADEYLEPMLIEAIRQSLPGLEPEISGLDFKLKVVFKGQWIRHGGYYKTILTRAWRTGVGHYEQRWMDEKIVLRSGRSELVQGGDLVDESLKDIGWWTDKHNRYATRQMVDFINREHPLFPIDTTVDRQAHAQARWKRFLRNRVFASAPLYLRSVGYFLLRYVVKLGFLDGRQGFVFHTLQGFWYFMLIDAKIDEARAYIKAHGVDAFRQHLITHHKISL
jgi:glycosyltransferase involved in cell wall biosynthesis